MTTAFVMSGGGSLAAVQVGMLQALAARGVEPDLLIGTSAGALNAGYVAGHGASAGALDDLAPSGAGCAVGTCSPSSRLVSAPPHSGARHRCAPTTRCVGSSPPTSPSWRWN